MSSRHRLVQESLRVLLGVLALTLGACIRASDPQPIDYGGAECDYCRMTISDPRFGAELVTAKGKVHQFDSIECLAGYYRQTNAAGAPRSIWVNDFRHPGTLIDAHGAVFVRTTTLHSPMGRGLVALAAGSDKAAARREFGGPTLTWDAVVAAGESGSSHDAEAFDVAHP